MIVEIEKFNNLSKYSKEKVLCKCEKCGKENFLSKNSLSVRKNDPNYELCYSCLQSKIGLGGTKQRKPYERGCMKEWLSKKIQIDENNCWNWLGTKLKKESGSYGRIYMGDENNRKIKLAHVISYETFIGPIAIGLEIDHICRNTLCVNPDHLEQVTHTENMRRKPDYQAKSCRQGHLYTEENSYFNPVSNKRFCKTCKKLNSQKRKALKIGNG